MPSWNELALYGFMLTFVISVIILTGPFGLVAIPLVLFVAGLVRLTTDSERASAAPVNCAGCGAPNDPGSDACGHCGDAL